MASDDILIITFCSIISGCLICVCLKYFKDRQTQIDERKNLKRIHDNLKRKNIILPTSNEEENCNEETKDERENQIRTAEVTNNEENV